jgi:hypothetical protein
MDAGTGSEENFFEEVGDEEVEKVTQDLVTFTRWP